MLNNNKINKNLNQKIIKKEIDFNIKINQNNFKIVIKYFIKYY